MRKIALLALAVIVIAAALYIYAMRQGTTLVPQTTATSTATSTGTSSQGTALALQPAALTFANGKTITLNIPAEYSIDIAAQGFHAPRFMAWSPDGRLFVGEMTSASDSDTGRVLIFGDFDAQTGTFGSVQTYLANLRNPNSVAFYQDAQGQEWIYIALTNELIRYPYSAGDNAPSAPPQVIATFPDSGEPVSAGGWHLTRTLAFNGDELFVSVGSGCNSCEETDGTRADILEMNPDGSGSHVYASGLRNAVGITYAQGSLFATANEVDTLGNDRPDDLVYKIMPGANYGWPYCYELNGAVYADTSQTWQTPYDCSKVPLAYTELAPHSAPLGITYFDDTFADPLLRNAFLVAQHGSGYVSIGNGYQVSVVRQGTSTPFVTGFVKDGTRQARPVDVLQYDNDSFFLTDDFNGAIYYVRYNGS